MANLTRTHESIDNEKHYRKGFSDGSVQGYKKGLKVKCNEELERGFKKGYDDGLQKINDEGREEAYNDGYNEGLAENTFNKNERL